jgi:hypothetical protein
MLEYVSKEAFAAALDVAKTYFKGRIEKLDEKKGFTLEQDSLAPEVHNKVLSYFDNFKIKTEIDLDYMESMRRIEKHIAYIRKWCGTVNFKELIRRKRLEDIYINLDTYLIPASRHVCAEEKTALQPLEEAVLSSSEHILILGGPGAGKTTAMKKLLHLFVVANAPAFRANAFPVLIRLKDVDYASRHHNYIANEIARLFNFSMVSEIGPGVDKLAPSFQRTVNDIRMDAFLSYVEKLAPLVVLDGFDEIPSNAARSAVLQEIRAIADRPAGVRIIITCRTGEISWISEDFAEFEIAPLSWSQIEEFALKWLQEPAKCKNFINEIRESPFADVAIKPLTLAQLCALYERSGKIPEKPKTVYKRVVRLLLQEWDEQRGVNRKSGYSQFDVEEKQEFLSHLAYYFSVQLRKYTVTRDDLISAYSVIRRRFRLPEKECMVVVREIESHTGLFIQSGFETFEYSHKSLQEYLAAEYIVKMGKVLTSRELLPSIVSELAIAVSISSDSTNYLSQIVAQSFIGKDFPSVFYASFLNRLFSEKPEFGDSGDAHFLIVLLFSLWFCNGKLPRHQDLWSNQARFAFEGLNAKTLIDIREFFDHEVWKRLSGDLLDYFERKDYLIDGKKIVALEGGRYNYPHHIANYLVLPGTFVEDTLGGFQPASSRRQ